MKTRHRRGLYAPELLESRIAPATFTVNLADSGGGILDGGTTTIPSTKVTGNTARTDPNTTDIP